jgi:hypothetical protein
MFTFQGRTLTPLEAASIIAQHRSQGRKPVAHFLREIARDKDTERVANIWRNVRLGALFAVLAVVAVAALA